MTTLRSSLGARKTSWRSWASAEPMLRKRGLGLACWSLQIFFFVRSLRVIQRLADGPRAPQSTGGMPCLLHDGSIGCTLIGLFCSSECGYAGHGAQPKCCAPMTFTAGLRLVQAPHHLHQRRERQRQVRDHERTAGAASYLLRQVAN